MRVPALLFFKIDVSSLGLMSLAGHKSYVKTKEDLIYLKALGKESHGIMEATRC